MRLGGGSSLSVTRAQAARAPVRGPVLAAVYGKGAVAPGIRGITRR